MSAHSEHAKLAGVSTPCTAHHVNFGGGCLNCGFHDLRAAELAAVLEADAGPTAAQVAALVDHIDRRDAEALGYKPASEGRKL